MLNSRDISLLRDDVERNCRAFLSRCEAGGLKVLVTQTVRDREYQNYLYSLGRTAPGNIVTNAREPSFHSDAAGLAFDICQNIKGQEYSDIAFFRRCGEIGKSFGFSWGGDWKDFPDLPHFQWDAGGTFSGVMVREGRIPPSMPVYGEEDGDLTQERFNELMEGYLDTLREAEPSAYSAAARAWAEEKGIILGNAEGQKQYKMFCTREQMITFLKRLEDSRGE